MIYLRPTPLLKGSLSEVLRDIPLQSDTLYEKYNWHIAGGFMSRIHEQSYSFKQTAIDPAMPPLLSPIQALERRSRRFYMPDPLEADKFACLLAAIRKVTAPYNWLGAHMAVLNVEGYESAVYRVLDKELEKVKTYSLDELRACINGMWWIPGSGFALFFSVNVKTAALWYGEHPRAYINLLLDLGRIAQSILNIAINLGLGGWMTPAIRETLTCSLLGIENPEIEPLYFLRLGTPNEEVWEYEKQ